MSSSMHNLAAWNTMMTGFVQHGFCQEILDLLHKMSQFGIEPDETTYLGVITHAAMEGS